MFWQKKTNEDSQMVARGDATVGAGRARRQRETQQGGIQGAAVSGSRPIPSQGMDRPASPIAARDEGNRFSFYPFG